MSSLRRSPLGVASVGLWLLLVGGGVAVCALFFYLAVFSGRNVNGPGGDGVMTAFGLVMIGGLAGHLLGIGLGVAGLVRREPWKLLAIAGIALHGLVLLGAAGVAVLAWLGASV